MPKQSLKTKIVAKKKLQIVANNFAQKTPSGHTDYITINARHLNKYMQSSIFEHFRASGFQEKNSLKTKNPFPSNDK